jgi:hypothetical protein
MVIDTDRDKEEIKHLSSIALAFTDLVEAIQKQVKDVCNQDIGHVGVDAGFSKRSTLDQSVKVSRGGVDIEVTYYLDKTLGINNVRITGMSSTWHVSSKIVKKTLMYKDVKQLFDIHHQLRCLQKSL